MTTERTDMKKRAGVRLLPIRHLLPTAGILFCMGLFLRDPALAREAVLRGLRLSATNLLPAIFPFLVFSDLLTAGGGLPGWVTRLPQTLFRLPAAGCEAILFGWVCGFPVGARCAVRALEQGRLTAPEAERAIAAASVPSPAFLIGAVGVGLFQDHAVGVLLEATVLIAALTVGMIDARFAGRADQYSVDTPAETPAPFAALLTSSVRKAALTSLNLAAFVVFFSAVTAAVDAVLSRFGAGAIPRAAVGCLLELSTGTAEAAALPDARPALLLCAAAAGWSGLSVHFQIRSVCDGCGLHFTRYYLTKALHGVFCAGILALDLLIRG